MFVKVDHYPCAFRIAETCRREDGTICEFRIGKIWYKDDWTPKPPKPIQNRRDGGCCG